MSEIGAFRGHAAASRPPRAGVPDGGPRPATRGQAAPTVPQPPEADASGPEPVSRVLYPK